MCAYICDENQGKKYDVVADDDDDDDDYNKI